MRELTLRQVEVIRAVMMTGTINGAAEFLHVSAPGISRLVKHAEASLGVRLFERKAGLFVPAAEAAAVFEQVQAVYEKMAGLSFALDSLQRGRDTELAFASVPSVAQFLAARAVKHIRRRFPDLYIDLNIVKIEEAIDYLLLERGEFVAMSYRFPHPSLQFRQLGTGELVAIVPEGHPLAAEPRVSVQQLAKEPLIGVDASDPYGAITALPFAAAGIERRLSIKGRFAQTVVSLVRDGLGVALIDEFSVAGLYIPGVARIPLTDPVPISVYAAQKSERVLSSFAEYAIARFRDEVTHAIASRPWAARRKGQPRGLGSGGNDAGH
jgi:DNA-binding transcriptional LysR family regulator